jgi:hypothetical protein
VFKGYYRRGFAGLGEPLTDADGLGDEAVAAALTERRLVAPAALADYYAVAGRHRINRQHNRVYSIGELAWQGGWLVFMEENQCVALWGVARADAGAADPVVWQAPNAEPLDWFAEPYRVSQFLMAMWRWQLTGEQEPGEAEPGAAADRGGT